MRPFLGLSLISFAVALSAVADDFGPFAASSTDAIRGKTIAAEVKTLSTKDGETLAQLFKTYPRENQYFYDVKGNVRSLRDSYAEGWRTLSKDARERYETFVAGEARAMLAAAQKNALDLVLLDTVATTFPFTPQAIEANMLTARIFLEHGEFALASERFHRILEASSKEEVDAFPPNMLFPMALAYARSGQSEKAKALFEGLKKALGPKGELKMGRKSYNVQALEKEFARPIELIRPREIAESRIRELAALSLHPNAELREAAKRVLREKAPLDFSLVQGHGDQNVESLVARSLPAPDSAVCVTLPKQKRPLHIALTDNGTALVFNSEERKAWSWKAGSAAVSEDRFPYVYDRDLVGGYIDGKSQTMIVKAGASNRVFRRKIGDDGKAQWEQDKAAEENLNKSAWSGGEMQFHQGLGLWTRDRRDSPVEVLNSDGKILREVGKVAVQGGPDGYVLERVRDSFLLLDVRTGKQLGPRFIGSALHQPRLVVPGTSRVLVQLDEDPIQYAWQDFSNQPNPDQPIETLNGYRFLGSQGAMAFFTNGDRWYVLDTADKRSKPEPLARGGERQHVLQSTVSPDGNTLVTLGIDHATDEATLCRMPTKPFRVPGQPIVVVPKPAGTLPGEKPTHR